jgi:oligoribonuclease
MVSNPLVWIDCEMTGLDLTKDKIIEIAVVITDGELKQVIQGPNLIIHQSKSLMDTMDAWCTSTHGKSGLTASVLDSTLTTQQAELQILDFIQQHVPLPRVGVLAGNSVHVDRQFLQQDMPRITDHLHYRIVDVSTLKELAYRWHPKLLSLQPRKKETHRALDDILESIQELKFYQSKVFKH